MPLNHEAFDLAATLNSAGQAFTAVVCHVFFYAALHGLGFAIFLGLLGLILARRGQRFGKPLMAVCRKLSLFCFVLMIPGGIALGVSGALPSTGTFEITSLGFLVFWSLISLHLSAEEMNFQWF